VIRKFLPPLQSFNICDTHSGKFKEQFEKDKRAYQPPTTLAGVAAELKRFVLFPFPSNA
jgi:hypothetical protein